MDDHSDTRLSQKQSVGWSSCWRDQRSWLRSVALARLGDREAVDEVLQNVAVAALTAEQRATPILHWGPWLYRVVVRQCLLFRRQRGRQRRLHTYQPDVGDEQTHAAPSALEWLLAHERQSRVQQGLAQLPHGDAELLMLKYVERWSYGQMAESLGVSHSTIESRLHRARRRLRAILESSEP